MEPKTLKKVLKELKAAAEGDKPEKLACAVGDLLHALPTKKPPKAAAGTKAKAPAGPTEDELEDIKTALDEFENSYEHDEEAPTGVQKGLFGGGNWKVLIPLLVDLGKKLLDSLLEETETSE